MQLCFVDSFQDEELGMLREYYFHLIGQHRIHDDQTICLDILNTLTKGGQNLLYIDEQVSGLICLLSKETCDTFMSKQLLAEC